MCFNQANTNGFFLFLLVSKTDNLFRGGALLGEDCYDINFNFKNTTDRQKSAFLDYSYQLPATTG